MKVSWRLTIVYDPQNEYRPRSNGFFARNAQDVEAFGLLINVPVLMNDKSLGRMLRVELSEGDPRLQLLLERVERTYGWKPSRWFNVPLEERSRYFGVRKNREYTKKDLDGAAFLSLLADKPIASHDDGTVEQVDAEVYVAEADRLQSAKTHFGALFPFQGYCVTEPLGRQLKDSGLKGLSFEQVVILPTDKVKKPLLKLSSTFIAPRSLLPLVNESGHQIEPNTEWACYLDDGGYHPHEFKYRTKEMKQFQEVDIAMSYERTGVTKARAYRWCIVSQRFRQVMSQLKVPGVNYAPVHFVD